MLLQCNKKKEFTAGDTFNLPMQLMSKDNDTGVVTPVDLIEYNITCHVVDKHDKLIATMETYLLVNYIK